MSDRHNFNKRLFSLTSSSSPPFYHVLSLHFTLLSLFHFNFLTLSLSTCISFSLSLFLSLSHTHTHTSISHIHIHSLSQLFSTLFCETVKHEHVMIAGSEMHHLGLPWRKKEACCAAATPQNRLKRVREREGGMREGGILFFTFSALFWARTHSKLMRAFLWSSLALCTKFARRTFPPPSSTNSLPWEPILLSLSLFSTTYSSLSHYIISLSLSLSLSHTHTHTQTQTHTHTHTNTYNVFLSPSFIPSHETRFLPC